LIFSLKNDENFSDKVKYILWGQVNGQWAMFTRNWREKTGYWIHWTQVCWFLKSKINSFLMFIHIKWWMLRGRPRVYFSLKHLSVSLCLSKVEDWFVNLCSFFRRWGVGSLFDCLFRSCGDCSASLLQWFVERDLNKIIDVFLVIIKI
jgi:hypothetical protein